MPDRVARSRCALAGPLEDLLADRAGAALDRCASICDAFACVLACAPSWLDPPQPARAVAIATVASAAAESVCAHRGRRRATCSGFPAR